MRTGDQDRLRRELGKDSQLAARAKALRETLDPQAWLVALGAVTREHDLQAAASAMNADDGAALRDALGFSRQAIADDILAATHSVEARRANDMNYFVDASPAIAAFDGWEFPPLAAGLAAYHVTALAAVGERRVRIHFGCDSRGLTDLRAAFDIAGRTRPVFIPLGRAALASDVLKSPLDVGWLDDPRFHEATIRVLHEDGSLAVARLARDGDWLLVEHATQPLQQRLAEQRDGRLLRIQRTAADHAARHGRWPRDAALLILKAADWSDPAAPAADRGWADFTSSPPQGIELRTAPEPGDVAAIALAVTPDGRRAVTRRGNLIWSP